MTQANLHDALAAGASRPFQEAARLVLNCLGYRSERTLLGQTGRLADLPEAFQVNERKTKTAADFRAEARSTHVLFQVGDEEIRESEQASLLGETGPFDAGSTKSFLFVAVELQGAEYSRTRYSQFAREVNQGLAMPAFVLFRDAAGRLALAFVDRRPHKRDGQREVLGRVSLVRDIDPVQPHRAHVDILSDLALEKRLGWMESRGKSRDFDELRLAVLDALDTEALNRRFYKKLFAWFERAVKEATFPADENRRIDPEHHVIRLITRLMFIWFIKEKGLVAPDLFVEGNVSRLLRDYDPDEGDSWYRAVLQNLFFATLNTELDRRRFSSREERTHRVHSMYRYEDLMADRDGLRGLFEKTPFINGGLFECLDSSDRSQTTGGYRIDCFTDNEKHRAKLSIPNRLFFDEKGLVTLFTRYRFTVEENTPIEKEVALDPELLGSVFENLLAAVNPETKVKARKASGSFYTPRPVVDYMVREALLLSLAERTRPSDGDAKWWRDRLLYLLDTADAFNDAEELFEPSERERIVGAVADLSVLDPAVGSGAFLISVLHSLTLVLRRLDPDNELWETEQRRQAAARAKNTFLARDDDDADRKAALDGIDETFKAYRGSDFGRKLYLIQNCLHGVDIQPTACLISKLRFFISLAIEQETSGSPEENFGIRPLPNLETRIVAADALVGIPRQAATRTSAQERAESGLRDNRERHFHAASWEEKRACRTRDSELRQELREALRRSGVSSAYATQVAAWDPYDQNTHATWFDPTYMFGVDGGFDVVLANPPYVESRNAALFPDKQKAAYRKQAENDWGVEVPKGSDLLIYFFWRGARLLEDRGQAVFITQNAWLATDYGYKFQCDFSSRARFERIIDSERKFFPDATTQNINTIVSVFSRRRPSAPLPYRLLDASMNEVIRRKSIERFSPMKWGHQIAMSEVLEDALRRLTELGASGSPAVGRATAGGRSRLGSHVAFGQGLNFTKSKANGSAGGVPVVMKRAQYVNMDHETRVDVRLPKRRRIPALFMPRGIGERHYCTMNLGKSYTYSHVEVYLPEFWWETDIHYCLWAFMNSSLVWLYRETTGRRNLGGGMLKAEATDMKPLPLGAPLEFGEKARRALVAHGKREPMPVAEELLSREHLELDDLVFGAMGMGDLGDALRGELLAKVSERVEKARRG